MAATITDKIMVASSGTRPNPTTLTAQKSIGASLLNADDLTGWGTSTPVTFVIYKIDSNGNEVVGTRSDWKGIVSGNTITQLTLTAGTDTIYPSGSPVIAVASARWADDFTAAMLVSHNQNGTLKDGAVGNTTIADSSVSTSKIGDAAVTAAKIDLTTLPGIQQAWQSPSLLNSWVHFGSPFNTPAYYKDSLGMVHFKGVIKSGTNANIFVLPVGYRPLAELYMMTNSNTATAVVRVKPTGEVYQDTGSTTALSLDNLHFRAEN